MIRTEAHGAFNVKAKHELDWTLRYPSWRQDLAEVYRKTRPAAAAPRAPARARSDTQRIETQPSHGQSRIWSAPGPNVQTFSQNRLRMLEFERCRPRLDP
jgi:hypothetical protein